MCLSCAGCSQVCGETSHWCAVPCESLKAVLELVELIMQALQHLHQYQARCSMNEILEQLNQILLCWWTEQALSQWRSHARAEPPPSLVRTPRMNARIQRVLQRLAHATAVDRGCWGGWKGQTELPLWVIERVIYSLLGGVPMCVYVYVSASASASVSVLPATRAT